MGKKIINKKNKKHGWGGERGVAQKQTKNKKLKHKKKRKRTRTKQNKNHKKK